MSNKLEFFTEADWPSIYTDYPLPKDVRVRIAETANAKLNSALGPVVYACYTSDEIEAEKFHKSNWSTNEKYQIMCSDLGNTHQAYLFNIQPIVKEECIHRSVKTCVFNGELFKANCLDCGAQLVAEWKVKE